MADVTEAVGPPAEEPEAAAPEQSDQLEWVTLARRHFSPWCRPGGRWPWLTLSAAVAASSLPDGDVLLQDGSDIDYRIVALH